MSSQKAEDPANEEGRGEPAFASFPEQPGLSPRRADWELPAGVDRGLWDYVCDPAVARGYDTALAGSALFKIDLPFVERYCPPSGWLIDLGCATGRLLIAMARRGTRVLGVDLSAEMLAVTQAKAREEGVAVDLVRANLTEMDSIADRSFDCAACLFSTLGMIRGFQERKQVIAHVLRMLKPGGRFVLHIHNRWFNLWNSSGRRWLFRNALGALVGSASVGDRLMPVHQGISNLTLHLFTRCEILRLLRSVGFRILEVKPISLRIDGKLSCPWWFGRLRAYGYLIAAERC
jgi:2-polyprenyl-3-methyl-5-hydroxy-6-metoxy-1,4-benzoquinol methylase